MTKIQIELPDTTAKAALEAGLLTPQALEWLLTEALARRQAGQVQVATADRVAAAGIGPVSREEIDVAVTEVRAERRQPRDRSAEAVARRRACIERVVGDIASMPVLDRRSPAEIMDAMNDL